MTPESLIDELVALGVTRETAASWVGYLTCILYSYEFRDFLDDYELLRDYVKAHKAVLDRRSGTSESIETGGWP